MLVPRRYLNHFIPKCLYICGSIDTLGVSQSQLPELIIAKSVDCMIVEKNDCMEHAAGDLHDLQKYIISVEIDHLRGKEIFVWVHSQLPEGIIPPCE